MPTIQYPSTNPRFSSLNIPCHISSIYMAYILIYHHIHTYDTRLLANTKWVIRVGEKIYTRYLVPGVKQSLQEHLQTYRQRHTHDVSRHANFTTDSDRMFRSRGAFGTLHIFYNKRCGIHFSCRCNAMRLWFRHKLPRGTQVATCDSFDDFDCHNIQFLAAKITYNVIMRCTQHIATLFPYNT